MSQSLGPYTNRYGLVFGFDTGDVGNTYKGEPTTNLSYNNGQGGSEYLASVISWVNAGSWVFNDNETDVTKPSITGLDTSNLRILSGKNTTESGSVHFGCGFTYLNPSTTYTVSVWYRQSRAGVGQPYLRTNITNVGLGNLSYNGNTDASTWPVNQWIRISASGTTAPNEDGLYISNYIGTYVNDKIWYFGHQVEEKNHMTPLVAGTRSATQGLTDFINNRIVGLSNSSFSSSANPTFDGTNDYLDAYDAINYRMGVNDFTLECVMKQSKSTGHCLLEARADGLVGYLWTCNYGTAGQCSVFLNYGGNQYVHLQNGGYTATATNQYYHMVAVIKRTTGVISFYVNGTKTGSDTAIQHTSSISPSSGDRYWIGGDLGGNPFYGDIPLLKQYTRALTQSEISQNYNNYKKRFNL